LYAWIYDPVSRPRAADLLPHDQPFKPWPPVRRWRFNAGLRALAFWGLFGGAMLAAGMVVVMAVLAGGGVDLLAGSQAAAQDLVEGMPLIAMVAAELVAAVAAYAVLARGMERRRRPLELAWRRAGGAWRGAALGFAAIGLVVGVLALLGCYRVVGFNAAYSPWADLFTLGLTAGVAEELMFRGAVFRLLEDTFGSAWAIAADCLVFGLIHLGNADATWLGGFGIAVESLVFPGVYMATRSLWWTMGLHFAWNVAQGPVFGSVVSGSGAANSWLVAQWTGPEWLTGGAFGIEASVVSMALLGGFGAWLVWRVHRSGNFVRPSWRRRRLLAAGPPPA
jgi:membrane protease YdiL (CAAX protease family)